MCRLPEIVPHGPPEHVDEMEFVFLGPRPPDGMYQAHRCVNCDRWAYGCPSCGIVRCDSDLWHRDPGHYPVSCRFCLPGGPPQIGDG